MKKAFISLVLLVSMPAVSGQSGDISISLADIYQTATDRNSYVDLVIAYENNEPILTWTDITKVYYGYAFRPEYMGDNNSTLKGILNKDLKGKCSTAWKKAYNYVAVNPVSLVALRILYSCSPVRTAESEIKLYTARYTNIIKVIEMSGDGDSAESPFRVICTSDAEEFVRFRYGIDATGKSEKRGENLIRFPVGSTAEIDDVSSPDSDNNNLRYIYFDIELTTLAPVNYQ